MKFRYYQKPGKDSQIYKSCFKSCSVVYHFIALCKLDCSLFSQCDSEARACLEESGHCDPGPSDPLVCDGQPALTFDSSYQHPLGPVCDWPFNTQSSTSVVTGMTVTMEASVEIIIVLMMWQQLCLLTNRQVRLKYYNTITSTKARLFSLKQMKVGVKTYPPLRLW